MIDAPEEFHQESEIKLETNLSELSFGGWQSFNRQSGPDFFDY